MKLSELEQELINLNIPKQVQLNKHTLILDSKLFIESHIMYIKTYKGNPSIYMPYYWESLSIEYDDMPVIKVYYNNSKDAYSKIDRIIITNTFKDDFKFPYRGISSGNGVLYNVIDNSGKKIKIFIDFSGYEEDIAYFDIVFKYSNIEYAYRILKP